jgi:ferritin
MKSAMQELMQWMEETEFMVNVGFIDKVNECFEKEKEQIIKAHTRAYLIGEDNISIEIANKASEQYYNETYNQNQ